MSGRSGSQISEGSGQVDNDSSQISEDSGQVDNDSSQISEDSGQVGGIEVLSFGFLIFVSVTLIIVNAWGVIDAKLAVTSAAREAVRAYVETNGENAANVAAIQQALETLDAYGRGGHRATVNSPVVDGLYRRCGRVTITVSYDLPTVVVPFIGGFGSLQPVTSTFTEVIDPFRSGLDGIAQC